MSTLALALVSRNRLVVEALERSLDTASEWPPELLHMLATPIDQEAGDALEKSLAEVRRRRVSRARGRSPVR